MTIALDMKIFLNVTKDLVQITYFDIYFPKHLNLLVHWAKTNVYFVAKIIHKRYIEDICVTFFLLVFRSDKHIFI